MSNVIDLIPIRYRDLIEQAIARGWRHDFIQTELHVPAKWVTAVAHRMDGLAATVDDSYRWKR